MEDRKISTNRCSQCLCIERRLFPCMWITDRGAARGYLCGDCENDLRAKRVSRFSDTSRRKINRTFAQLDLWKDFH